MAGGVGLYRGNNNNDNRTTSCVCDMRARLHNDNGNGGKLSSISTKLIREFIQLLSLIKVKKAQVWRSV